MNKLKFVQKYLAGILIIIGAICAILVQSNKAMANSPWAGNYTPVRNGLETNYIVTFDGEGEATVASSLEISNLTNSNLKEVQLEIPGKTVSVVRALHHFTKQEKELRCTDYYYSSDNTKLCNHEEENTATKDYVDILDPKTEQISNATKVTIPLKTEIEPSKNGTIYLVYKANGYTENKWGGLSTFAYNTPTFSQPVDSVDVAVYADPELYLFGSGKGKTNYVPNITEGIAGFANIAASPMPSATNFSKAIDEDQTFTKKTTNLDAGESLSVTGRYATSWFRLYWIHLLGTVAGVGIFIVIIWIGERSLERKQK